MGLSGRERAQRLAAAHSEETIICSVFGRALDAVRAGITTVIDAHASPGFVNGSLSRLSDVLLTVGLRAGLGYRVSGAFGAVETEASLVETRQAAAFGGNDRVCMMVAVEAADALDDATLRSLADVAARFEVPIRLELDAQDGEREARVARFGKTPLARLDEAGLIGPTTTIAGGSGLDDDEVALLRERGAMLVLTPRSDLVNHRPRLPLHRCRGLAALGTGEGTLDLFAEARLLADLGVAGREPTTPDDVIAALGAGHRLASALFDLRFGRFEPGYEADLVMLDHRPLVPLNPATLARHVLYELDARSVVSVMVEGRFTLRDRSFPDVDVRNLYRQLQRGILDFWRRLSGASLPGYRAQREEEAEVEEAEEELASAPALEADLEVGREEEEEEVAPAAAPARQPAAARARREEADDDEDEDVIDDEADEDDLAEDEADEDAEDEEEVDALDDEDEDSFDDEEHRFFDPDAEKRVSRGGTEESDEDDEGVDLLESEEANGEPDSGPKPRTAKDDPFGAGIF